MTMSEGCKEKWSDVASFSFDEHDTASEMFMFSMKAPALTLLIPGIVFSNLQIVQLFGDLIICSAPMWISFQVDRVTYLVRAEMITG